MTICLLTVSYPSIEKVFFSVRRNKRSVFSTFGLNKKIDAILPYIPTSKKGSKPSGVNVCISNLVVLLFNRKSARSGRILISEFEEGLYYLIIKFISLGEVKLPVIEVVTLVGLCAVTT